MSIETEYARQSIVEELQAINAYDTRIRELIKKSGIFTLDETDALKKLLVHNMEEEKEHVAMLIEWLRKYDKSQDEKFKEKQP
jgi:uncharacterized protein